MCFGAVVQPSCKEKGDNLAAGKQILIQWALRRDPFQDSMDTKFPTDIEFHGK